MACGERCDASARAQGGFPAALLGELGWHARCRDASLALAVAAVVQRIVLAGLRLSGDAGLGKAFPAPRGEVNVAVQGIAFDMALGVALGQAVGASLPEPLG